MSVTIPHTAYEAMLPLWQSYRVAYIGEPAVKGARDLTRNGRGQSFVGTRYLPQPAGMKRADQYAAYRDRPSWLGATEYAVQGITGSVFRHEPQVRAPSALEPQLADITQTGVSLREFAEDVVSEDLLMGRFGLLVDYPQVDVAPDGDFLLAPVDQRPYWIRYETEEIINWRTVRHQGKTILSLVVLRECVPVVQGMWGTEDFFVTQDRVQYRVLRLNERGQYEVSLWVEDPGSVGLAMRRATFMQSWLPLRQGVPLDFIPFKLPGAFSLDPRIQKSLLDALIHRNFLCWRHAADYEHALHLTAMPTFYVAANMEAPPELYVGAGMALFLPDNQAKVGLVEFHGQGLQPHENALKQDLEIMAMFGARLLEGPPKTAETATGVQWRMAGSDSPVQRLIGTCSQALTWALQVHAWWNGSTDNIDDPAIGMTLNKDLVSSIMEPQMLQALMQALLNGTISYETFFFNLQRGEIARPLVEVEEERALVEDQQAQRALVTLPPGPGTLPPGRNGTARAVA
jgi:Domain of unknown function (DUF4055)